MKKLDHMKSALFIILLCLGYPAAPVLAESHVTGGEIFEALALPAGAVLVPLLAVAGSFELCKVYTSTTTD